MKTLRWGLVLVAVVLVVVALSAFRVQTDTATLTVVEHADSDTVTDTGATGDSVGDILTFANPVYDEKNENPVGSDQGYCFRTEAGKSWECNWTLLLDDGQITVEGPFLDKGDTVLSITGGTGNYANVRGQMTLHARNDKGTEYDFVYEMSQ